MKIYIKNQQRLIKVNQQRIRSHLRKALLLLRLQKTELSILLVNDSKMRILNRLYRGVDRTTDVLSFPQISDSKFPHSEILLGDIVINIHQAKRQAAEHGLTFYEELKLLLIHGLLHLLDYDHEKGKYQKTKMRSKEKKLLDAISQ
ncbi:MAG: rRNA maturation RNase YbeY [Nitrospirae bacterium RBG_13_39_12]|nr:MAG: rRNA maturation RNase YbeY [Nitrospirae bacterium RBG_13_39_12]